MKLDFVGAWIANQSIKDKSRFLPDDWISSHSMKYKPSLTSSSTNKLFPHTTHLIFLPFFCKNPKPLSCNQSMVKFLFESVSPELHFLRPQMNFLLLLQFIPHLLTLQMTRIGCSAAAYQQGAGESTRAHRVWAIVALGHSESELQAGWDCKAPTMTSSNWTRLYRCELHSGPVSWTLLFPFYRGWDRVSSLSKVT